MTWFRCGGSGIPAALKNRMNAVFNKKFGTAVDYPPEDWPDDVNLMGPLPEKTIVSSPIADSSDGADDVPTKSLVVTIPPTLDGVSSVTETQTGRNLLNYADTTNSYRITSLTDNGGGSFTVVASGLGAYIDHVIKVKAGQAYSIKCTSATNDEGNASQIGVVNVYDGSDDTATLLLNGASISTRKGFTPTGNYILVRNKVTGGSGAGTGTIVEPQLELGSTAHAYEPYQTPTQYSASLGRTIYGGEVDIVNGEGMDGYGIITFDGSNDENWGGYSAYNGYYIGISDMKSGTRQDGVCNQLTCSKSTAQGQTDAFWLGVGNNRLYVIGVYDSMGSTLEAFRAYLAENPLILVYPIATPTDFTFDGQEINTRLGYNAFWSDQGDTEVTYRADISLALQAVSNSRGLMMATRPAIEPANDDQGSEESTENNIETEGEEDAR